MIELEYIAKNIMSYEELCEDIKKYNCKLVNSTNVYILTFENENDGKKFINEFLQPMIIMKKISN